MWECGNASLAAGGWECENVGMPASPQAGGNVGMPASPQAGGNVGMPASPQAGGNPAGWDVTELYVGINIHIAYQILKYAPHSRVTNHDISI